MKFLGFPGIARIDRSRLAGCVLVSGRRTVTATLRILKRDPDFCAIGGRLLILLIKAVVASGAAVIGIDTIALLPNSGAVGEYQSSRHHPRSGPLRWSAFRSNGTV